jgi:hypothetical protein
MWTVRITLDLFPDELSRRRELLGYHVSYTDEEPAELIAALTRTAEMVGPAARRALLVSLPEKRGEDAERRSRPPAWRSTNGNRLYEAGCSLSAANETSMA